MMDFVLKMMNFERILLPKFRGCLGKGARIASYWCTRLYQFWPFRSARFFSEDGRTAAATDPIAALMVRKRWIWALMTRNCALKTRNFVSKTRNSVFMMMNLAGWRERDGDDRPRGRDQALRVQRGGLSVQQRGDGRGGRERGGGEAHRQRRGDTMIHTSEPASSGQGP